VETHYLSKVSDDQLFLQNFSGNNLYIGTKSINLRHTFEKKTFNVILKCFYICNCNVFQSKLNYSMYSTVQKS